MDTQTKRQFKTALYEQFARISRAMANPHRLELLDLLTQGERSVEDLARETALSVANASQHLQTLRAAQLVAVRRDGLYAYYRLADPRVQDLWLTLRAVGETQLADLHQVVETFLQDRTQLQAISIEDLRRHLAEDAITVLDVRPPAGVRRGPSAAGPLDSACGVDHPSQRTSPPAANCDVLSRSRLCLCRRRCCPAHRARLYRLPPGSRRA